MSRTDYTKRGTLRFKSPGQTKASGPDWEQEASRPDPTKEKSSVSLSCFRSQPHTNLEAEAGTRVSLVTFSSRRVFLQSPCPGGPGDLLNDRGFGDLLPQGDLMHLALVGSC